MSNPSSTHWRFLIVEDNESIAREIEEKCKDFVPDGDTAEAEICHKFKDAIPLIDSKRYDVFIIDLKEDNGWFPKDDELAGLHVYEEVKKRRFVPVVFYTALPKHVLPEQTAFVRVVEKTDGLAKLMVETKSIFDTHLPALSRHLDNEQREYFWDFLGKHWKEMTELHHKVDLVYLIARRLAQTLRSEAIRSFVEKISRSTKELTEKTAPDKRLEARESVEPQNDEEFLDVVHPIELYIYPSSNPKWQAGDILRDVIEGRTEYWLVLTPSCDFEHGKVDFIVLAKCLPLCEQKEYLSWAENTSKPTKNILGALNAIIGDNRSGQKERFKFLPGTFFVPDLVVDFQQLRSVRFADLNRNTVIASLDSPFAEAVLAKFSRYFGRLGTPDVNKEVVLTRLQSTLTKLRPTSAIGTDSFKIKAPIKISPGNTKTENKPGVQ